MEFQSPSKTTSTARKCVRRQSGAVLEECVPSQDAEVARRSKRAGAIVTGKLDLHEFAAGGTSATTISGRSQSPARWSRNPCGSSEDSAAAISSEMCFTALGTDTGISIRRQRLFAALSDSNRPTETHCRNLRKAAKKFQGTRLWRVWKDINSNYPLNSALRDGALRLLQSGFQL